MAATDKHPLRQFHQELTLQDIARRFEDGRLLPVVNALSQINECVEDFLLMEAKYPTGDIFAYETALPEGQWAGYGEGTHAEKSDQDENFESIGSITGLSRLNFRTARASGDVDALRNQEDMRYVKGMSQTLIGTLFYGHEAVNPSQFTGLTPRFNSRAQETVFSESASVITSTDNSSLWLVNWDPDDGVCLMYPRGRADKGISIYNMDIETATDYRNGGEYMVYRTFFDFEWGLMVKREDMVCRVGDILTSGGVRPFNPETVIDALVAIWQKRNVKMYANRKLIGQIEKEAYTHDNVWHTSTDPFGVETRTFRNTPVKMVEQLLGTETGMAA